MLGIYLKMKDNMFFNSQHCTSIRQANRLLNLGLSPETADMFWLSDTYTDTVIPVCDFRNSGEKEEESSTIPSWSLGRLIELCPRVINSGSEVAKFNLCHDGVRYECENPNLPGEFWVVKYFEESPDLFENLISCIEWLVEEGYFKKEYLEDEIK